MSILSAVRDGLIRDFKAGRAIVARTSGPNPANEGMDPPAYSWSRRSATDLVITEETALEVPAVYAAVNLISSAIAALPVDVYQQIGPARVPMDNAISQMLSLRPNPEMAARSFWETLVVHILLYGNAFIFVTKGGNGAPLQLWPLEPKRVRVGRSVDRRKYYEVDSDTPSQRVMVDFSAGGEMIHVAQMSINGLTGTSPINKLKEAIALAKASEEYSARFFSQNATPAGTISTDKELTIEQSNLLRQYWQQQHSGLRNAQQIAVLSNGAHYQPISISPENSQLLEQRKFQIAEIERIYRTPPHLLADVDRSTSWGTGIEEQARNFVEFTLNPWITLFEHAINQHLLDQQATDRYIKFNVNGILRADTFKRFQTYALGLANRIETVNEVRALEDLPPIDGGDEFVQPVAPTPPAPVEQAEPAAG